MEKRKRYGFEEILDMNQHLKSCDSFGVVDKEDLLSQSATKKPAVYSEKLKYKREKTPHSLSFLKELGMYAAIIVFCLYIIPNYVVQRTLVDGPSMENALYNNENVLVDKISYHFTNPDRFDIIVFYPQGKETEDYYVKRIIGLPEETIQIKDGAIYINDKKLNESYGKNSIIKAGIAAEPITLGKDEYFVLGDNRLVSKDSRYSSVGIVKKDYIDGKVWLRIWPLEKIGQVE